MSVQRIEDAIDTLDFWGIGRGELCKIEYIDIKQVARTDRCLFDRLFSLFLVWHLAMSFLIESLCKGVFTSKCKAHKSTGTSSSKCRLQFFQRDREGQRLAG